jgi:hypothetical protein
MQGHHIARLGFTQALQPFLDPGEGFAQRRGQLLLCPVGVLLCEPAQAGSLHDQLGFGFHVATSSRQVGFPKV